MLPYFLLTGLLKHTQTLCRTLLTDVARPTDQLEVQSHMVSFGGVGFMVGPIIGGHLAELENGFYYVCCIVTLFFWINFGKYSAYTLFKVAHDQATYEHYLTRLNNYVYK
jgi:MFS family permease